MVFKTENDFLTQKHGKLIQLIKLIKLKHVSLNLKALSNLLFCFNSKLVSFTGLQWDDTLFKKVLIMDSLLQS